MFHPLHVLRVFLVPKHPISKALWNFHGPKCATRGSKRAKNTCLSIPKVPGSLLVKLVCDPFSTHFWSQKGPFKRHFGIFHGPKRAKNTRLSIPSGLGTALENIFGACGPWWNHRWPSSCAPARPSGQIRGLETTKMGGCGGLGALGIWFRATPPKIRPVLGFGAV